MNYFELLRLAAPEAVLVVTALIVLALGLATERAPVLCSGVAAAGLLFASAAVLMLPPQAALFNGTPRRLVFDTVGYFVGVHHRVFYPRITVDVYLDGGRGHYHVPVLASMYSFSTYLGS